MELLNRRREIGGKNDCPYQRVEYLEVNEEGGLAYIDTDYIPNGEDIDIYISFTPLGYCENEDMQRWFSCWTNSSNIPCYRVIRYQNDNTIALCNGTSYVVGGAAQFNQIYFYQKYEIVLYGQTQKFTINGIEGSLKSKSTFIIPNTNSITIFGDIKERITFGRCNYFKVVKNGIMVLYFIPVRIGEEGYMYDRVSGKLFGNAGNGKFILGPDVN